MFALIRLMIALGPDPSSSDVACANEPDRAACVETACRVSSGLDYAVDECDGLADHLRRNPPCSWIVVADDTDTPDRCRVSDDY